MPLLLPTPTGSTGDGLSYENIDVIGNETPGGTGVWVTLLGRGGAGGRGHGSSDRAGGGGGGGGGAKVGRVFIPMAFLGPTWSVTRGTGSGSAGNTVFASGSIVLTAGGGAAGQSPAFNNQLGSGGPGGIASASGISIPDYLFNGTAGAQGAALDAIDNLNGAGPGGGGGCYTDQDDGRLRLLGGDGGNSVVALGGLGANQSTANPGQNAGPGEAGGGGAGGGGSTSASGTLGTAIRPGGPGGRYGAGGGGGAARTINPGSVGGLGGDAYSLVEWV